MRVGIIGTGNMGGMLARAFAETRVCDVNVMNRTREKAEKLALEYARIYICDSLQELFLNSNYVILATKPHDGTRIMEEYGHLLTKKHVFCTTISSIPIHTWEDTLPCPVIKVIPSLTQQEQKGILLMSYSPRLSLEKIDEITSLFTTISSPVCVDEEHIRICSDLTSCGPAFLAFLCAAWSKAAGDLGQISTDTAEYLLRETFIGTARLFERGLTFHDILHQIAIPGGITAHTISELGEQPQELFHQLHQTTHNFSHNGMFTRDVKRATK